MFNIILYTKISLFKCGIHFTVLLVNGSIIFPLVFRALSSTGKYVFEALVHVFPSYILACALNNYIMLNLYNRQCRYFNTCDTEFYIEDPCCRKLIKIIIIITNLFLLYNINLTFQKIMKAKVTSN